MSDESKRCCKRPRQDVGVSAMEESERKTVSAEMTEQRSRSGERQHAPGTSSSPTERLSPYSSMSPLPQQHPRLSNAALPGCIVHQDFHCVVLSDTLGQEGVDQCLSFHPNGLAVVQLAPTHPVVGDGDNEIVSADFDAGGCNVMETTIVKGKKKKGALQLYPTTVLCSVETRRGKKYKISTGTFGELMQANKALLTDPGLMSSEPLGRGWVAIVRLKPRDLRRLNEVVGVVDKR